MCWRPVGRRIRSALVGNSHSGQCQPALDVVCNLTPWPARGLDIEKLADAFEAFNRRDVEAFIAAVDVPEDYEWRPFLTAGIEGGVYRGPAGTREWFANLDEVFESFSLETLEMRDLGDRLESSWSSTRTAYLRVVSHSPVTPRRWHMRASRPSRGLREQRGSLLVDPCLSRLRRGGRPLTGRIAGVWTSSGWALGDRPRQEHERRPVTRSHSRESISPHVAHSRPRYETHASTPATLNSCAGSGIPFRRRVP